MTVAISFNPAFPIIHVIPNGDAGSLGSANKGITSMRRLIIALAVAAVAAPMLSGCIIIASEKPTTRVIHSAPAESGR